MIPAPPDQFGPYKVLASLGAGGMGEVWKARDTRLDRIVAVKASKAAFDDRFEREARAVAALKQFASATVDTLLLELGWGGARNDA